MVDSLIMLDIVHWMEYI